MNDKAKPLTERVPSAICILGATGTGKSSLALFIAKKFGGAIINIDSRQIYSDLEIITAQPKEEEKAELPHFLYGFLPCNKKVTAGIYANLALESVLLCHKMGLLPVLVGGTGLYTNALLRGIAPIPVVPEDVRRYWQMRCEFAGSASLYKELTLIDPEYALKISSNDPQRVTRALEVYSFTGHPFSWWHKRTEARFPFPVLKIALGTSKEELDARLEQRIQLMIERGAKKEVLRTIETYEGHAVAGKGNTVIPAFSSIGFRELRDYIEGKINLRECTTQWLASTRAYAKRQNTWFKKDSEILWLSGTKQEIEPAATTAVNDFLEKCNLLCSPLGD